MTVDDLRTLAATKRRELGITEAEQLSAPKSRFERFAEASPEEIERMDRRAREEDERERLQLVRDRVVQLFRSRPRYAECTLDNFEASLPAQKNAVARLQAFSRALPANIRAGSGALFFGPAGTGKDHLMAALMRRAADIGFRVAWRNGMDLFGEIRDLIKSGRTEKSFIDSLVSPHVLAISDPLPPVDDFTPYQAAMFSRIVWGRYDANRPIWATMNAFDGQEVESRLGAPMASRLSDRAITVRCQWPSYRRPA